MRMFLIASLAAISACSAAANQALPAGAPEGPALAINAPVSHPASAHLECDIQAVRTSRGMRLEATAQSESAVSGDYEFIITKRDRSGSSDIVQGGAYDLLAGDAQSLGSAEISLERRGGYSARLVLSDDDAIACSAETG